MIYTVTCNGRVIGFAGRYSLLYNAGLVSSCMDANKSFTWCFKYLNHSEDCNIYSENFAWLMQAISNTGEFCGKLVFNPVQLFPPFDSSVIPLEVDTNIDMYDNDVCAYFDCMYSDGCNVSECDECIRNGRRGCPDCVYFGSEDCPDSCTDVSDCYPVGYPGGDLEEWQRQSDGALADLLYG